MKKIFTLLMVASLSLVAAYASPVSKKDAMRSLMAKERLSSAIEAMQRPSSQEAKLVTSNEPALAASEPYAAAKAPAEWEVVEVYFESFYDDPMYYDAGDWLIVLKNERYQFNFDFYNHNPESPVGTYPLDSLDVWFSWCTHPDAPNETCYYKACSLTIKEEKVNESIVKYILDAEVLATIGIGGEVSGAFKLHAEHQVIRPKAKMDVAILNCVVEPEEDRFRIYGKNDTMDVDLTFFTDLGVEGYYTHKMLDEENYKLVHRGTSYEIMELEGIITSTETMTGGMAYVFLFEALTEDAYFFNVAMEAPILPTDTIEISCNDLLIDDSYGMSDATILVTASNSEYEIMAGYNANSITTPAEYPTGSSYIYLTDLRNDKEITSMQSNLSVKGNKLQGYQVDITMLGNDHKYYIMHLVYGVKVAKEMDLNFTTSAKSMFYIDQLGSKELQLANYNGEYSVSFDFFPIDEVLLREDFERKDLVMDQTFIIHHVVENGQPFDAKVKIAEISGKLQQKNNVTYLTADVLGFDSTLYHISMFYEVPTPTKTVTYTFDGFGNDDVEFINAISEGAFIFESMSEDGNLMAKVQVERITTGSVEGTFYNDGQFQHNDFNAGETYVQVWNDAMEEYETFSVQKGTMTVTVDDDQVITAVASFICDDAVQYDLTFITQYTRVHLAFDSEEGEVDYTYAPESYYEFTTDYVESHNQLYFDILAADNSNVTAMVFFVDHMDSDITVPEGVYPINSSMALGTVYASPGVAVGGGPIQSYFCYTIEKEDGIYYDQEGLYCLVEGTVTVKKVDGKLSIDVDAYNSYDLPVKLHFSEAATALEDITTGNTNSSKRLINGQLFILRNGKTYNANGALVK